MLFNDQIPQTRRYSGPDPLRHSGFCPATWYRQNVSPTLTQTQTETLPMPAPRSLLGKVAAVDGRGQGAELKGTSCQHPLDRAASESGEEG